MTLKELRIKKHLKQNEASALLNIPLRTYKRYESNESYQNTFKYKCMIDKLNEYTPSSSSKIKKYNIAVIGAGYVGLSLAVLLAKHHNVTLVEINEEKVELINKGISPFYDPSINEYLKAALDNKLKVTCDYLDIKNSDYVVIATPTNYDSGINFFDTSSIESVISKIKELKIHPYIVIKSTVPLGYTSRIKKEFRYSKIMFSPEFLREGHSIEDNLYPSRIIVGGDSNLLKAGEAFISILKSISNKSEVASIYMGSSEAESVKLFANAYLAMRVAYFNELDTYAETKGLNTQDIVKGISYDPRIGDFYNNPSFGYGGYCLPKDTKQLESDYKDVPNDLIKSIVESNKTRKDYIAKQIIKLVESKSNKPINEVTIGVYRLVTKKDSDNFRAASIFDVINNLKDSGANIIIYEPNYSTGVSLEELKECSDLVIANRYSKELDDIKHKVYTRDLFSRD